MREGWRGVEGVAMIWECSGLERGQIWCVVRFGVWSGLGCGQVWGVQKDHLSGTVMRWRWYMVRRGRGWDRGREGEVVRKEGVRGREREGEELGVNGGRMGGGGRSE